MGWTLRPMLYTRKTVNSKSLSHNEILDLKKTSNSGKISLIKLGFHLNRLMKPH